jgi:TPR repeat protein
MTSEKLSDAWKAKSQELVHSVRFGATCDLTDAAVVLATLYEAGVGVREDLSLARDYYIQAAESGSNYAKYRLSRLRESSPQLIDADAALSFAKEASEANYAPGLYGLARLVEIGSGTRSDLVHARELYERSAEMGFGPAASYLAAALESGIWGLRDQVRSVHFAVLGASLGMANSAQLLGRAYEDGAGVEKDHTLATAWYTRAAEGGDGIAALRLVMAYSIGGLGVECDMKKAKYFSDLAERHGEG